LARPVDPTPAVEPAKAPDARWLDRRAEAIHDRLQLSAEGKERARAAAGVGKKDRPDPDAEGPGKTLDDLRTRTPAVADDQSRAPASSDPGAVSATARGGRPTAVSSASPLPTVAPAVLPADQAQPLPVAASGTVESPGRMPARGMEAYVSASRPLVSPSGNSWIA
jgi:hypothetical protein